MSVSLPYAGTTGYSGSSTSKDKAVNDVTSGRQVSWQKQTINYLHAYADFGMTWKELSAILNVHHGTSSAILSSLHKTGKIVRTSKVRKRCKIYLLPEYVTDDIVTETQGRGKSAVRCLQCGSNLIISIR